jgi:hypothetical protein
MIMLEHKKAALSVLRMGSGWETRDGVESEWGRNDAIYAIYFPLFFLTNPRRRRAEAAKNLRVVGKHETAGKAKRNLISMPSGLFVSKIKYNKFP